MTHSHPRILLASASPRRVELLGCIVPEFDVQPANLDEEGKLNPPLEQSVQDLAGEKARHIASDNENAVVIGADTVVTFEGEILEKPRDAEDARRMLRILSGREHEVLTGIAVIFNEKYKTACETTRVKFGEISEHQIDAYVRSGEPFDKAGAYGIQGRASIFVESISGCYFNVVGLPLNRLAQMLEEFGISTWERW